MSYMKFKIFGRASLELLELKWLETTISHWVLCSRYLYIFLRNRESILFKSNFQNHTR